MSKHCCNLNDAIVCNACASLRRQINKEWRAKYESPKSVPLRENPYPKVCSMVGVHPTQIKEASQYLQSKGVEPVFNPEGSFCPQSRKHMKQYAKAMGMVWKNE